MENLKIEVEETKTYRERMKFPFLFGFILLTSWILLICLFLFLQHQKMHDSPWIGIFCYFILLIIYTWGCDNTCAYYITVLEINEARVHIIYKKRNKEFELNDSLEKFGFKKGIHRAGPYFSIN